MYGELTITAPNGETYHIDGEDLYDIAYEAETAYTNRSNDWGKEIKTARGLARWISNLPLQHEAPGSWHLSRGGGLVQEFLATANEPKGMTREEEALVNAHTVNLFGDEDDADPCDGCNHEDCDSCEHEIPRDPCDGCRLACEDCQDRIIGE